MKITHAMDEVKIIKSEKNLESFLAQPTFKLIDVLKLILAFMNLNLQCKIQKCHQLISTFLTVDSKDYRVERLSWK